MNRPRFSSLHVWIVLALLGAPTSAVAALPSAIGLPVTGHGIRAPRGPLPSAASLSPQRVTAFDGTWKPYFPEARYGAGFAYDSARKRMLVFGGWGANTNLNDTWALTLTGSPAWSVQPVTGTIPPQREGCSAIYDPVRDRLIVFGGYDDISNTYYHDVWALSLSGTMAWTNITPPGGILSGPTPRYYASAIYDPIRDRMLVYGGYDSFYDADIWALSLSGTVAWTKLNPGGAPVDTLVSHSAIYDPVRDRMLVFGGYDGKAWHNGVGALTLAGTPSWSKLAPGGTLPNPIAGCRTAYDPVRDRLITFGGYDGFTFENGVWALSLAGSPAWSQLSTSGTPASTRSIVALVYDPNGDRVVISHGTEGLNGAIPQLLDDTWSVTLSGTPTWSELPPGPNDPAPRVSSSGIYDPGGTRMLIFGGYDGRDLSIATIFNDTHAFSNGATPGWSALAPTGTPPAARLGHSAIYDPIRHRMIVFGGRNYANGFNDVWALSLTGTPSWSLLAPTGTPPVARWYHTAVYDSKRDRMLVFGGVFGINNYNDVWELTLSGAPAWNLLAPTGAPPAIRNSHAAIYDPLRDRMVVYGGYNNGGAVTDLWALNLASGPAWSPLSMLGGPLTMSQSTAIYDPVRDRMLISGGFYGITSYTAVSALSLAGTPTWSALAPAGDVPAVRGSHASAYDPTHDQLLVFGGSGSVLLRDIAALFWGTPIAGVGPNEGITSFALAAPRPNPSRESSAIDFEVPSQSHVRLAVYDLAGRQVRLIEDAPFAPGRYTRHWDGTDAAGTSAPAGVYFLKLEAPGASLHAKLVRLR